MDILVFKQLIRTGRYQVKLHAVQHALQEGFNESDIREAILNGQVIETYPERSRALICGQFTPFPEISMYLHIICEQRVPEQMAIITAYIPNDREWGTPPTKRRKGRR